MFKIWVQEIHSYVARLVLHQNRTNMSHSHVMFILQGLSRRMCFLKHLRNVQKCYIPVSILVHHKRKTWTF